MTQRTLRSGWKQAIYNLNKTATENQVITIKVYLTFQKLYEAEKFVLLLLKRNFLRLNLDSLPQTEV